MGFPTHPALSINRTNFLLHFLLSNKVQYYLIEATFIDLRWGKMYNDLRTIRYKGYVYTLDGEDKQRIFVSIYREGEGLVARNGPYGNWREAVQAVQEFIDDRVDRDRRLDHPDS